MELQIQHITSLAESNPLFQVVRRCDGKHSQPVALTPPSEVMVGIHNSTLQQYLKLPLDMYNKRASEIQETLSQWGRDVFDALFYGGLARDWYQECKNENLANLRLKITSDDPAILAWPWEALESKHDGCPALQCMMERQLCDIGDAHPPADTLTKDQLNILYIIARPYGENDVGFQTLARPLINFAFNQNESWPVHIDLLRPPTFEQLRKVLQNNPGFYHIVHFDGHGGFGDMSMTNSRFSAPSGMLLFEYENGIKNEGEQFRRISWEIFYANTTSL